MRASRWWWAFLKRGRKLKKAPELLRVWSVSLYISSVLTSWDGEYFIGHMGARGWGWVRGSWSETRVVLCQIKALDGFQECFSLFIASSVVSSRTRAKNLTLCHAIIENWFVTWIVILTVVWWLGCTPGKVDKHICYRHNNTFLCGFQIRWILLDALCGLPCYTHPWYIVYWSSQVFSQRVVRCVQILFSDILPQLAKLLLYN